VSGVQTVDQRIDELLRLRDRIDAELVRLAHKPGQRRSRKIIPPCGTETAYQRHRYYGEPCDDECRAAHARHERVAALARKKVA
jgi:hypothetical protein